MCLGRQLQCSAAAAGLAALVAHPLLVSETRMCLQYSGSDRGIMDTLRQTVRQDGVRGLYRGLVPAVVSLSAGVSIYRVASEGMRSEWNRFKGEPRHSELVGLFYSSGLCVH